MSTITEQVGAKIRETRKAKGLTLKELGERLGMSESVMSRYEKGKVNASIDTLTKIATELNLELEIKLK